MTLSPITSLLPLGEALPKCIDFHKWIDSVLPTEQSIEVVFDRLWPIHRSITGNGFRESVDILSKIVPLERFEVPSGTKVFDWTVPREWNIQEAWLEDENGQRVADSAWNNLHVLSYSVPVDVFVNLDELQEHLYSLPEKPDAIPYVTSYYMDRWGFCLSDNQRRRLKPGRYHAVIRSTLEPGSMTLSHAILESANPGGKEILLGSYLCHPSMANNELSGPIVIAFVMAAMASRSDRKIGYRGVIVPETIGSISYLQRFGAELKRSVAAGFVVTCCGDGRAITYKRSRDGEALVDELTIHELLMLGKPFHVVDFCPPDGSEERQYCSPGFNLPVGSLMRSMYGTYPEYHTSLDNKSCISFASLRETMALYLRVCLAIELNAVYRTTIPFCEPMLGPRDLYPTVSSQGILPQFTGRVLWLMNQADGKNDLLAIARKAQCSILDLAPIASFLVSKGLLVAEAGQ